CWGSPAILYKISTKISIPESTISLLNVPIRRVDGRKEGEETMGAVTTGIDIIAGVILGWITIEIACKPCLEKGRDAIDRNLDPDYDPDDQDNNIRAPLNPNPNPSKDSDSTVAPVVKKRSDPRHC
ncbi:hypothetical protein HAX54_023252, partial [Datura stramonium]|nr:hypothetical protein [Datura stramonium]